MIPLSLRFHIGISRLTIQAVRIRRRRCYLVTLDNGLFSVTRKFSAVKILSFVRKTMRHLESVERFVLARHAGAGKERELH